MRHLIPLALAASLCLSPIAGAADADDAQPAAPDSPSMAGVDPNYPAIIGNAITSEGMKLIDRFDAAPGVEGWAMQMGFQVNVVYTTKDGQFTMVGPMLSSAGENLTQKHVEAAKAKTDQSELWEFVEALNAVQIGEAKSNVYVVYEPHCGYCRMAWDYLRERQDVSVNIVPVSFMRPDSGALVKALFEEEDKRAVMDAFSDPRKAAELAAKHGPMTAADEMFVQVNWNAVNRVGIRGTPAVIWKDSGGIVNMLPHMPSPDEFARLLSEGAGEPTKTAAETQGKDRS